MERCSALQYAQKYFELNVLNTGGRLFKNEIEYILSKFFIYVG